MARCFGREKFTYNHVDLMRPFANPNFVILLTQVHIQLTQSHSILNFPLITMKHKVTNTWNNEQSFFTFQTIKSASFKLKGACSEKDEFWNK